METLSTAAIPPYNFSPVLIVMLWSPPLYGDDVSAADPIGRGFPLQGVLPVGAAIR